MLYLPVVEGVQVYKDTVVLEQPYWQGMAKAEVEKPIKKVGKALGTDAMYEKY